MNILEFLVSLPAFIVGAGSLSSWLSLIPSAFWSSSWLIENDPETVGIAVSSTFFSGISTALGQEIKEDLVAILQTQAYIESMDEQELTELINKLENVNIEFENSADVVSAEEKAKVYSKKVNNKI